MSVDGRRRKRRGVGEVVCVYMWYTSRVIMKSVLFFRLSCFRSNNGPTRGGLERLGYLQQEGSKGGKGRWGNPRS